MFYSMYNLFENVDYYPLSDLEDKFVEILDFAGVSEKASRIFFNNINKLTKDEKIVYNFNHGVLHFDSDTNDEIIGDVFINYNGGDIFSTFRTVSTEGLHQIIYGE